MRILKKKLFIACGNQTILNSVAIKEQYFREEYADLLIVVQLNESGFDYNLYKVIKNKRIFNNIYILERSVISSYINKNCNSRISKLFYSNFLKKYFKYKFLPLINNNYDEFFCPMFYHFIPNIIDIINLKKNLISITFYEEGTSTYDFPMEGLVFFDLYLLNNVIKNQSKINKLKSKTKALFNEFYRANKLKKRVSNKLYVYWPEHIEYNNISQIKLESVIKNSVLRETYESYCNLLSQEKLERYEMSKVIFMTTYIPDTEKIQLSCIDKILKIININDIIIKTHPSSTNNRKFFGQKYGKKLYFDRDAYYFDALNIKVDFTDKIIVSLYTSTVMNCKTVFDREPYVIFLYKLIPLYYEDDRFRNIADKYVSDLTEAYSDKHKIVVPDSIYEYNYYLSLFKMEINNKQFCSDIGGREEMEIRLLKIDEFDYLIKAIKDLWNENHIYCRNPELLKYLVYYTPYRKDFCQNDIDTTYFVIFNNRDIIGFSGMMPMEGNIFGKTVAASTGTILKVNKKFKFIGIDLIQKALSSEPYIHVGLGMNDRVMKLYKALGWYTFNDLPRWVWTNNYDRLKEVFQIPESSNLNCMANHLYMNDLMNFQFDDIIDEEKWNEFYNVKFAPKTIGIKRDYKFLNWRYISYPFFEYKLLAIKDELGNYKGLVVYRIEEILDGKYQIGRILEFIYEDIDYGIELVKKLQALLDNLLFWDFYCLSSITALALERCGFVRLDSDEKKKYIPTRFQPIDYEIMNIKGAIRLNNKAKKIINMVTDQQWYVTRGDGDQDRPN